MSSPLYNWIVVTALFVQALYFMSVGAESNYCQHYASGNYVMQKTGAITRDVSDDQSKAEAHARPALLRRESHHAC